MLLKIVPKNDIKILEFHGSFTSIVWPSVHFLVRSSGYQRQTLIMPLLTVKTNISANDDKVPDLLTESIAKLTGKPKERITVIMEDAKKITFGGTREPCAMIYLGRALSDFTSAYFRFTLNLATLLCHSLALFSFSPLCLSLLSMLCPLPRAFFFSLIYILCFLLFLKSRSAQSKESRKR